jgi:hypothetical protein
MVLEIEKEKPKIMRNPSHKPADVNFFYIQNFSKQNLEK